MRWLLLAGLLMACDQEMLGMPDTTADSDAQYICESLTHCFSIDVGVTCAADIEATTSPADIGRCADCYGTASCAEIGAPGEPGVCDVACHNALFGGAP